jgi:hypothetical protein
MYMSKTKVKANYFYESHFKEISKYISNHKKYINIVNSTSSIPDRLFDNILTINPEISIEEELATKNPNEKYDLIVLTDIFELSDDIYNSLKNMKRYLNDNGLLILSSINPLWYLIINLLEKLGLKDTSNFKSYINPNKIENILRAANYEKIKSYNRLYLPFKLFGLGNLINYIFYIFLPFLNFGIRNYLVYSNRSIEKQPLSKSILVPAKNEEGNLEELIVRIPKFQTESEIIIISGESTDNTHKKSLEIKEKYKNKNITVIKQSKNGKANAIWEGLEVCSNDLVAILDSDLSVDPETLNEFFEIIENGHGDFVNGTRLIYKMETGSMQKLNKFGNRFFQYLISKLISTNLTDSLCGTKVFKKSDIDFIKKWQHNMYFKDPFCDFDLIFSAAYSSKKIVELPVYYRARKYGTTNISRFKDGRKLIFYFLNSYFLFKTDFIKRD